MQKLLLSVDSRFLVEIRIYGSRGGFLRALRQEGVKKPGKNLGWLSSVRSRRDGECVVWVDGSQGVKETLAIAVHEAAHVGDWAARSRKRLDEGMPNAVEGIFREVMKVLLP